MCRATCEHGRKTQRGEKEMSADEMRNLIYMANLLRAQYAVLSQQAPKDERAKAELERMRIRIFELEKTIREAK